ncbi:NAD(+) diphosphatase [Alsobacter sp. KACC 23698]|uniref:NAD(+) diphosphatase n=1 Tax=Alsobacter sp. KACC 23698 TaxID=3149229 RepID=A0AAU7JG21_9HYPH
MSTPSSPPVPGERAERSASLGYSVNRLDRRAEHRDDADYLAGLAASPKARSVVLRGDVPVLRRVAEGHDALFSPAEVADMGSVREEAFLGLDGDAPVYAALLDAPAPENDQGGDDLVAIDLRSIAMQGLLPPPMLGVLAQAKSLMHWHQRHRFCSNCGQPTRVGSAGWKRECPACEAQHFPRTDPVVIMLAVRGDRCVLGRQARFVKGVYSCLAGFLEPGETLEDAVRRELFEEAGVQTGQVRYLASQPWPFPASLMIGCVAEALADDLTVDFKELEDARWFTRDEVRSMLKGQHPDGIGCPPPIAIAHGLLRAWAEDGEDFRASRAG